jgi:hypothetical protein
MMNGAGMAAIRADGDPNRAWRDTPLSIEEARAVVRYAVSREPAPFDPERIAWWAGDQFPATDRFLLEGLLIAATVNDPRRQHYPEPQDLMFRRADGRYERYEASVHGRWTKSGRLRLMSASRHPGASGTPALVLP